MIPKLSKTLTVLAASAILLLPTASLHAHCQVPCGIFADQLRFEAMLEDHTTIAKAIGEISAFTENAGEKLTPVAINQVSRWVQTKEDHCNKIQKVIADYFMAQRIKPGDDNDVYVKQLTAAHAVMRAAMKAKQDPSAETAEALEKSIFDLYRAYEGKEPDFHKH